MVGSQYHWLVKNNIRAQIVSTNILTAWVSKKPSIRRGNKQVFFSELCSILTVIHQCTINMSLKHMADYSV